MAPLATAAATHVGRVRRRNEDSFLVDPTLALAVVADGMGGHPAGDVASRMAVDELRAILDTTASEESSLGRGEGMVEAVRTADAHIRAEGASNPERSQMGTTLTALVFDPDAARVLIVHVGDSRAYLYDDGRLRQLTTDHTWVQQQIDAGALTPAEARGHPRGHVLTQVLGVGDGIEPQLVELGVRVGQLYLLCSDGLTTMLPDIAIERVLVDALPQGLDAAARALVDAANDRGGVDNITVVLGRIE